MDPGIPSSFIPKRPIEPGVDASATTPRRHTNALTLLIIIIILATAGAYAITYVYETNLNRQVASAKQTLTQARDGIGTDFVSDMKRLNDRISAIKSLLANHVVVTPIFQALEATTLRSVQYKSFTYTLSDTTAQNGKNVDVTLQGTTKNYATLALQSDAFLGNPLIKNPVFSDLAVNDTAHAIDFKLGFQSDAHSLSYEAFIASLGTTSANTTVQTTAAATTNTPTQ